jgi:hypothetical protein
LDDGSGKSERVFKHESRQADFHFGLPELTWFIGFGMKVAFATFILELVTEGIIDVFSDEPFEPFFCYLTDGAYPRGMFPCAEIPADFAPPDRVRQGGEEIITRGLDRLPGSPFSTSRASFGDG